MPITEIDREKLYDLADRAENLARAAYMLGDQMPELSNAGCPPIMQLLEMVMKDLNEMGLKLSP